MEHGAISTQEGEEDSSKAQMEQMDRYKMLRRRVRQYVKKHGKAATKEIIKGITEPARKDVEEAMADFCKETRS